MPFKSRVVADAKSQGIARLSPGLESPGPLGRLSEAPPPSAVASRRPLGLWPAGPPFAVACWHKRKFRLSWILAGRFRCFRMLTSKKTLGVLLLIGLLTVVGHCFLRYQALQRCLASGCVELENWEGWTLTLEKKIFGGPLRASGTPAAAFLPFHRPGFIRVGTVPRNSMAIPVVLSTSQVRELGKDIRLLGLPEELHCGYQNWLGQLFSGIGQNPRLRRISAWWCEGFDDEAVSRLSLYPNLRELEIRGSSFSGSGFPPLANLEDVDLFGGKADGSIFPALLACRALKKVSISGPDAPLRGAEALRGLPNIERISVTRTGVSTDSAAHANNSFTWER